MLRKKRKNGQILLKSAQECWKCKIVRQIRKSAEKVPSAIRTYLLSRHFLLKPITALHTFLE